MRDTIRKQEPTLPSLAWLSERTQLHQWLLCVSIDLVLYCEAFLTTYRTFISPEELIKKLQYRYPSQVCSL